MTEMGLVLLVSSWFRLLGTLSVKGLFRQSGVQLGGQKLDRSGVLWDLDLLGDLLGTRFGRLCLLRAWSWWPHLRGTIGGL